MAVDDASIASIKCIANDSLARTKNMQTINDCATHSLRSNGAVSPHSADRHNILAHARDGKMEWKRVAIDFLIINFAINANRCGKQESSRGCGACRLASSVNRNSRSQINSNEKFTDGIRVFSLMQMRRASFL